MVPEALFEAEIEVMDRAPPARITGFIAAFDTVLVKLTGSRAAAGDARIADLRDGAQRFVATYRYLDPAAEDALPRLWVRFDGPAIEHALAERGMALWGLPRPPVLVWMVVQETGSRVFAAEDLHADLQAALKAAGRSRGLPLILPLLDIEDRQLLSPADIAMGFHDRILAASARYSPGAVLTVQITGDHEDRSEGRWSLYHDGERLDVREFSEDTTDLVGLAIDHAADTLAARLAAVRDTTPLGVGVLVRVEGLRSFSDFGRAQEALLALPPVSGVRLTRMEGGAAVFEVDVRGGATGIERAVSAGSAFAASRHDVDTHGDMIQLRLLP